ncbi:HAMP domain-containing protein [Pseudomonas sp. AOB-7]|uniref:ATP-binding protein n=1 Tax=Pseudomonas sp. AOB-7 TaxID=2482750 RepID=UPI000EFBE98C|nr:ATP-binding protein [Pseudomonas sp. AOB-7]RMH84362.1 HAMP domain-containing protein [Pseudomonas sp. AOB-7]
MRLHRTFGSMRIRLLVLLLLMLAGSFGLISHKIYSDSVHEVRELFDAQLSQTARLLMGLIRHDLSSNERRDLQAVLDEALMLQDARNPENLLGHEYEGKLAFQMLDDDGELLFQSASAPPGLLEEMIEQLGLAPPNADQSRRERLAQLARYLIGYHSLSIGEHRWRVFVLHDSRDYHWVLAGEREDVRGELIGKIARRSLQPLLIGLPAVGLLLWLAVGWGLSPLQRMAHAIRGRAPDNLAPLVFPPLPNELEPMAAALNRLLLQVNQLLDQEKRFIADAAHELRTPLAVLRIHAQNALEAADAGDRSEALRQLTGAVDRATRVVTQLLTLARLDPSSAHLSMGDLDLLAFLRGELAELTPLALDRQQDLVLDANESGDYRLIADAPSLGILLQNLVSNAVQYTPKGGCIQVQLIAEQQALVMRVQDSGPGVPAELRERLFERFFRLGEGLGAGLGLSIVLRVVELHQGSISLEDSPLGGLQVTVRLPKRLHP